MNQSTDALPPVPHFFVFLQVQDRFKLDLTDEEADAHFLGLVSQSITAIAPRVMEVMHQIRVAAR